MSQNLAIPGERGRIDPPETKVCELYAGRAHLPDGRDYIMSNGSTNGVPVVRSLQTFKVFTLSWNEILDLAIRAGIDLP